MSLLLPPLPTSFNQQQMQTWWQQVRDGLTSSISALEAAQEFMLDIPAVTITADYTGAITPSAQLPKTIVCQRFNSADDVSDLCNWAAAARNNGVACSIDSTGNLSLTAVTASDTIDVTSVRDVSGAAVQQVKSFQVTLSTTAAPAGSGGGSTESIASFFSFNSTSYTTVGSVTATAGASGQIQLSAPLNVTTDAFAPAGNYPVHLIWHDSGGDLGTGQDSSPDCKITVRSGQYSVTDGGVTVVTLKTGLTPGNSYSFDLNAKNLSGSRDMYLYGEASAVGS